MQKRIVVAPYTEETIRAWAETYGIELGELLIIPQGLRSVAG